MTPNERSEQLEHDAMEGNTSGRRIVLAVSSRLSGKLHKMEEGEEKDDLKIALAVLATIDAVILNKDYCPNCKEMHREDYKTAVWMLVNQGGYQSRHLCCFICGSHWPKGPRKMVVF